MNEGIDPAGLDDAALPFGRDALSLEAFGAPEARDLAQVAGDVTLLIDPEGVIRDIALGDASLRGFAFERWIGQHWIDTATAETRPKIEDLLAPSSGRGRRWRQVNHIGSEPELPIRYLTMPTAKPGWIVAIGRDLRGAALLQQRLIQTQQAMERDYIRLRQAESRYRLLFNQSAEAILVVDAATRRVTEANPAALRLCGGAGESLAGRPLATLFHADDRDRVIALLGSVAAAETIDPVALRLAHTARDCDVAASLFRQGKGAFFLVRLAAADALLHDSANAERRLAAILERMPDGFVLTDGDFALVTANSAFLDLTQTPRKEQVRGQPLGRFIGRPGIDLNLLQAQLREHGAVHNFATILRDRYGEQEDVEISAVLAPEGDQEWIGLSIRRIGRLRDPGQMSGSVTRSVEQLTELVGRVSLREIVRESTDLIERLCIEAALNYTSDNRASAAEILGLSRQSLYAKLHRHGMANGTSEDPPATV